MKTMETIDCAGRGVEGLRPLIDAALASSPPLLKFVNLPLVEVTAPTPSHWRDDCATPNDAAFLRISEMFGRVYGYSDLQGGRRVQEIFPIPDDAEKQVGSGAVELKLHTEDPTLPYRAERLGFLCVSNADRVPTVVSAPDLSALSSRAAECLLSRPLRIFSDRPSDPGLKGQELVTTVLFRDEAGRLAFIYDPVYVDYASMGAAERSAFAELTELVESSAFDFLLEPGQIGILDNYRVSHGRPQYRPRYDGTDRWLKRTQISSRLDAFAHLAVVPGEVMP
jgi:hypothetical protein